MVARAQTKDAPKQQRLTLKEMVRGAHTTARAVRFYEVQKLIELVVRLLGGYRWFHASELDKLRLVIDLRTCGFSIEEIRTVLQAKSHGGTVREAATEVQGLIGTHLRELQRKVGIIERLGREFSVSLQLLDQCVQCDDPRGLEACPTCELPRQPMTPSSFHHIWAMPASAKARGGG